MARRSYTDVLEQDPTKKVSQEERIGRDHKKLVESDRRSLKDQIAQREQEITAKRDLDPDADVSEMKRDIEHKKMILQHDEDLVPKSDTQRDRLAARSKELETLLTTHGMCTKKQMWPASNDPLKMRYVKQNMEWQDRYANEIREWQDIQNKLEPDYPGAQSLELIRPD